MNFPPEQKLKDEPQLKEYIPSAHLAPNGLLYVRPYSWCDNRFP